MEKRFSERLKEWLKEPIEVVFDIIYISYLIMGEDILKERIETEEQNIRNSYIVV